MHLTWVHKRMAFFKFRVNHQDDLNANASQGQSMEVLRQRVRHRLIGSAILVLIAVIGFPLIFDTQPRPVALDIAIDIPDKTRVGVQTPPTPLKNANPLKTPPQEETTPIQADNPDSGHVPASSVENLKPSAQVSPSPAPVNLVKSVTPPNEQSALGVAKNAKPTESLESASVKAGLDSKEVIVSNSSPFSSLGAQAQSKKVKEASIKESLPAKDIKEKKDIDKPKVDASRFVIQVGAFTEEQKVKEIRDKLEKANLHTFTQVVTVKDAKKIRIRLGPFATKEEANQTLSKVHALGFNPSVISLP